MPLYSFENHAPIFANPATSWIAPTACLIGQINLAEQTSVWFGAVLRGDNEPITIGKGSNIQENVVVHTDIGFPLTIGNHCTIGHQAMLHGCTIDDNSLIGMGATVLNGAKIGKNSLVGAHALVPENKTYPDGSLIIGTPAKAVRTLSDEEIEGLRKSAQTYMDEIARYQVGLEEVRG